MSIFLAHKEWLWIALALAVGLGWLLIRLYRRERAEVRPVGPLLTTLRVLALLLILAMLLEPIVGWTIPRERKAAIAVVVDQSASMSLRDDRASASTLTRWAVGLGEASAPAKQAVLVAAFAQLETAEVLVVQLQREPGDALADKLASTWEKMTAETIRGVNTDEAISAPNYVGVDKWKKQTDDLETLQRNEVVNVRNPARRGTALNKLSSELARLRRNLIRLQGQLDSIPVTISEDQKTALDIVAKRKRTELAAQALAGEKLDLLRRLEKKFRVKIYRTNGFTATPAEVVAPITTESLAAAMDASPPRGTPMTALSDPLQQVADELAEEPLAGIVLLTDGQHNRGRDPETIATALGKRSVPIYAVGIGDPQLPPDISVEKVAASEIVFAGDSVNVLTELSVVGFRDATFPVRIEQKTTEGTLEIVAETTAMAKSDSEQIRVPLSFLPKGEGDLIYTVSVLPQTGEAIAQNNARSFRVHVVKEKLKVLFIEAEPRWEWRYLRHDLERDTYVDAKILLLSEAGRDAARAQMPANREQMFKYDVIVLGDLPPDFLTPADEKNLEGFVADRAGTLVVIAGKRAMPSAYSGRKLAELLPIVPTTATGDGNYNESLKKEGARWRVTPLGRENPLMALSPDLKENEEIWKNMPPFYWLAPIARAKPQAEVLIEAVVGEQATPLLATQYYGLGKVLWIGTDNTWRWRYKVADEYYHRFWGQVLRWSTVGTLTARDAYVRFGTSKDEFRSEEPIGIDARVLGADFLPLEDGVVTAVIYDGDGKERERVRLQYVAGSGGAYRGQISGLPESEYTARLDVPALPQRISAAAVGFAVREDASLEFTRPNLNESLLRQLARASGGRYYDLTTVRTLPDDVPPRVVQEVTRREIELWDSVPFFCLFAVVLCAEWILRKRKGLI